MVSYQPPLAAHYFQHATSPTIWKNQREEMLLRPSGRVSLLLPRVTMSGGRE